MVIAEEPGARLPMKPKSPVWMMALAFASAASVFRCEMLPRISATHNILPWIVSNVCVCVFTAGRGGTGIVDEGRVFEEVEAGPGIF